MLDLLIRDIEAAAADLERVKENLDASLAAFRDARLRELDVLDVIPQEGRLTVARDYLERATIGLSSAGRIETRARRMVDARSAGLAHPFVRDSGRRRGSWGDGM
jgi:hypothetical protein